MVVEQGERMHERMKQRRHAHNHAHIMLLEQRRCCDSSTSVRESLSSARLHKAEQTPKRRRPCQLPRTWRSMIFRRE